MPPRPHRSTARSQLVSNRARRTTARHATATLPAAVATVFTLVACSTPHTATDGHAVLPAKPDVERLRIEQSIGTLEPRWVLCEADCPSPTPKTPLSSPSPVASADATPQAPASAPASPPLPAAATVTTAAARPLAAAATTRTLVLNFSVGSARLDLPSRVRINSALSDLRRATSLRIEGRTDDIGDQALNDQLANARVLAVLHWIRDPQHRITAKWSATSQGLCCYVEANTTPEGRAANRRVEILMTFDSGERVALDFRPGKG